MSSPLEKFILENRDNFDAESPNPRVWEKINERMNPETDKPIPIRTMSFKRWMAAAAAVLLVAMSGTLYYSLRKNKIQSSVAGINDRRKESSNRPAGINPPSDSPVQVTGTIPERKIPDAQDQVITSKTDNTSPDNGDSKEMYYYTKLIELKHEELKTLEKDEPLLYRQFSGDVQKLDSVYHTLKTQLPNNSNREQVIEAMISNLQLQIGLLNKQLDIIKKIKHSKKTAYENAYKSV
ncbi:MAG TPA: hypothetical protein VNW49_09145 [Puia sp.]|jgi:hypothetical protein|nr:hypothetical protein [Puia sp.]